MRPASQMRLLQVPFLSVSFSCAIFLCVALPCTAALAADRDVCPSCTYTTIQSAISAASYGDRIRVAVGTYNETVGIGSTLTLSGGWDEGFTRQIRDPSATILDAGDLDTGIYGTLSDGADVLVENLTVQNGRTTLSGWWGAGLYLFSWHSAQVTVRDVIVQDSTSSLSPAGGILLETLGGSLLANLDNVLCRRNWAKAHGGGLVVVADQHSSVPGNVQLGVTNSVFYANTADTREGGAIAIWAGNKSTIEMTIVNNTITGNTSNYASLGGGGIAVTDDYDPETTVIVQVYNSIIYGNTATPGADLTIDTQGTLSRTDVYYSDLLDVHLVHGTYNTGHDLAAAPVFVNAPADDYRLERGSPGINAGTRAVPNPPGLPARDIQGVPRVMGPAPDLGAYELRQGIVPILSLLLWKN